MPVASRLSSLSSLLPFPSPTHSTVTTICSRRTSWFLYQSIPHPPHQLVSPVLCCSPNIPAPSPSHNKPSFSSSCRSRFADKQIPSPESIAVPPPAQFPIKVLYESLDHPPCALKLPRHRDDLEQLNPNPPRVITPRLPSSDHTTACSNREPRQPTMTGAKVLPPGRVDHRQPPSRSRIDDSRRLGFAWSFAGRGRGQLLSP